ncbi:MAG TPA: hypothetical protein DIC19_01510 [Erysipelotrichaceae bacterium]|nr:hypothetical protein [Erysipelotrichaceae bacterium]
MALSIEIRHGYVYLIEARTGKMSVGIQKTHYFEYPDDWVSESGIVNVEGFASLLMQHLKEQNMRDKKAYFCINNNAVIYRELNIPKVEEKKVHLLVKTEMMSALNLTPDYIMDYIYLNDVEIEGNVQSRVLGVAMQIKAIESLLEVAKLCKLDVQGIDSATNSIIKMMEENPLLENTNQLIVADIGNGHLRLYLFENGIYALSRNNKIISYKEVTPEEVTNSIVDNINKMIQFSYTRKSGSDSKKIVITGIDEELEAVQKFVSENLLVDCEVLGKPHYVTDHKFENRYTNAVGALLRK